MALDGKHKDREEVSVLLSLLYPDTIKLEQMAMGLTKLLVGAEDLALDVPEASHMLSLFLGRLIVDDSLPPSFLTSVLPSLEDNSLGVSIVRATGAREHLPQWSRLNETYKISNTPRPRFVFAVHCRF